MRLFPLLFLSWACSGPATPEFKDEVPDVEDSAADGDTDTVDETGDSGDTDTGPGETLALGEACEPGVSDCGPDAACCTECCMSDAAPICTELDMYGGCPLPDLSIDEGRMTESIDIQDVPFAEDDCAIYEGCVEGPGMRRLLKFATTTPNDGTADLHFGDPDENEIFEYSECHDHDHFTGYAQYELVAPDGTIAANGHKQAFCLMDYEEWDNGGRARYDCSFQGISVGWADTYDAYLDCQWIDITDVAAGDYTLRVSLNPDQIIPELSFDNNVMEVDVRVVDPADEPPVTDACVNKGYGEYRNCGWEVAGTFTCEPGASVTLGCENACSGRCWEDTTMRICHGADVACRGEDAIANNDDGCGGSCSADTFTCPSSGVVTALVSAWASYDGASCTIAEL